MALAIGCVFNSPALALEPKLMPIKKFILQPREYAKTLVSGKQFSCLDHLWRIESHWNYKAKNPTSTAFGIPQFLNQTWIDYNYPIRPKNPIVQVQAGIHYIKVRYQTPCAALTFHLKHGYY